MVDIQSATAENRRGKKKKEATAAKYNGLPYWAAIKNYASVSPRWRRNDMSPPVAISVFFGD